MPGDVPSTVPVDPDRPGGPPPRLALYRRYRPATFAEVKGQDHVTEPLRQALRTGRVNHAYLFSGPRGCGKTTSARILARSLNCAEGPTPDPCGKCESCLALAPDGPGSLDVIEIDAASHGGVDDARDLRERAFYSPVAGRFKIYIIDEAHMVTREGFNALLKLVEEPPPHLKFVFATTEPEKVIPTIRSRTHHYPFRLVPPAVLRELLEEILSAEQIPYEPAVLPLVVRAGAGSARDSLSVLDQLLAGAGDDGLRYDRTVSLLGYTDDSLLDEVTDAFAAQNGAAVFRAVNRVVEGGHDPRRFAADLLDRFRDLIVLAAVPDAGSSGLLDLPADRIERMAEQAVRFGQAELTRAAEIVSEGLIQMRGTTSPRLLLELTCAQILLPAASTGEMALLARLERLEHRLQGTGPAGAAGPADPAGPAGSCGGRCSPAGPGHPRRRGPRLPPSLPPVPHRPGKQSPGKHRPRHSPPGKHPLGKHPPAAHPLRRPAPAAAVRENPARDDPARAADPARATDPARAAAPAASARSGAESVSQRWPEILDAVKAQRRVAWMLLSNATVHAVEDGLLTLLFAREGEARGFSASGYDRDLISVLNSMLGVTLRVRAITAAQLTGAPGAPRRDHSGPEGPGPAGTTSHPASPPPRERAAREAGPPPPPPPAPTEPAADDSAQPDDPIQPASNDLTGMDLIKRELGGRVIAEIDET